MSYDTDYQHYLNSCGCRNFRFQEIRDSPKIILCNFICNICVNLSGKTLVNTQIKQLWHSVGSSVRGAERERRVSCI